jgi:hypothetical protein
VLGQLGRILAANLEKAALPAIIAPNSLVLQFPAEYNSQQAYCQEPKSLERIEEVVRKLTGKPWKVRVEAGQSSAAPPPQAPQVTNGSPRSRRAEAEQEPLLKRAIEVFGARVVHEEAGFGTLAPMTPERTEAAEAEEE